MNNEMPSFVVEPEQETPLPAESEEKNKYFEDNIGCAVSEEEALKLAEERLAPFFLEQTKIPVDKIEEFEKVYQEYLKVFGSSPYPHGTSDAVAYESYQNLRNADLRVKTMLRRSYGWQEVEPKRYPKNLCVL